MKEIHCLSYTFESQEPKDPKSFRGVPLMTVLRHSVDGLTDEKSLSPSIKIWLLHVSMPVLFSPRRMTNDDDHENSVASSVHFDPYFASIRKKKAFSTHDWKTIHFSLASCRSYGISSSGGRNCPNADFSEAWHVPSAPKSIDHGKGSGSDGTGSGGL